MVLALYTVPLWYISKVHVSFALQVTILVPGILHPVVCQITACNKVQVEGLFCEGQTLCFWFAVVPTWKILI